MKLTEADHMVLSALGRWPGHARLLDTTSIAAEAFGLPGEHELPPTTHLREAQDALTGLLGVDLVARFETRLGLAWAATERGHALLAREGLAQLGYLPFKALPDADAFRF